MHPSALTTGYLPHRDIDKFFQRASLMEDGDVQNLPQTSIESYTTAECICSEGVYTQMFGELDSQRPNFLSLDYFPPLFNQLAHWEQYYWPLATGPTVLPPWHMSGASVQVTLTPGVSDESPGYEFGEGHGFADDRIWANFPRVGLRAGRRITGQEHPFRWTKSPLNHGNGDDIQLCSLNPSCATSDSRSPHVSPQRQLEYIPDTHPNSPFEYHPDQRAEAPESSGFQRIPEMGTARGSRIRLVGSDSKEWPCDHDGCNKSYKRPQDVRRHVREKHRILPKCLICGIKWTRAENIRRHLIKKHRDHFTKKERQQIRHLQGLNNTIDFLNGWETTRL